MVDERHDIGLDLARDDGGAVHVVQVKAPDLPDLIDEAGGPVAAHARAGVRGAAAEGEAIHNRGLDAQPAAYLALWTWRTAQCPR